MSKNSEKPTLKDLRLAAGKTQIEIASEVGVREKAVRRWESMETIPTLDKAVKLAISLNCNIEQVLVAFGLPVPGQVPNNNN